jgi:hypothetical protein
MTEYIAADRDKKVSDKVFADYDQELKFLWNQNQHFDEKEPPQDWGRWGNK